MIERVRQADQRTRINYGLMLVFGAVTLAVAFSSLDSQVRMVTAALTFGLTVGLWVSHLVSILYDATRAVRE